MSRTTRPTDLNSAVGYIRVSTAEQADSGLGLEAQRQTVEMEAQRRGLRLVHIYEDAGASGKSMDRDGLRDALGMVAEGRAGTLIVAKLDRLSRSLVDFASLMQEATRRGWNLVAVDLAIDLSTPAGEFMANVMASAAQWERRIISQRTKDALAVKRVSGIQLGRPVVLPEASRRRIEALRASGLSLRAVAAHMNAEDVPTAHGGRAWYASTVKHVLDGLVVRR